MATFDDLFTGTMTDEERALVDAYLAPFDAPELRGGYPLCDCGAQLTGFLGSFTWGLCHGEGLCNACKAARPHVPLCAEWEQSRGGIHGTAPVPASRHPGRSHRGGPEMKEPGFALTIVAEIPRVPNFVLLRVDGKDAKISIADLTDEQIERLGVEWTAKLLTRAQELRQGETKRATGDQE